MNLLLPFLLLIQERSPVPALLEKIDGHDPAACFRAIADLADLAPAHRAEIEKGAGRLPDFYRDALLAELKLPPPSLKRVTLEGKRTFRKHLDELARRTGMKLDLSFWKENKAEDRLDRDDSLLACRDSMAMEALAAICQAHSAMIDKDALSDNLEVTNFGGPPVWALGQRSLVILHKDAWQRKWVDLSSRPEWQAGLHFNVVLAPGARIYGWKDVRIVEALSEKGGDLRLDPTAPGSSILDFKGGPHEPTDWVESGFCLNLRLPEGVQKVDRLKISAVARVNTKYRFIDVKIQGAEGKSRASSEELEIDVRQIDPREPMAATFLVDLRAKGLSGKDLAARPTFVEAACSGNKGRVSLRVRRVEAGSIEYEARWEPVVGDSVEEGETMLLEKVSVHVADGLEERRVYAEFRDLPLR